MKFVRPVRFHEPDLWHFGQTVGFRCCHGRGKTIQGVAIAVTGQNFPTERQCGFTAKFLEAFVQRLEIGLCLIGLNI